MLVLAFVEGSRWKAVAARIKENIETTRLNLTVHEIRANFVHDTIHKKYIKNEMRFRHKWYR